VKQFKEIAEPKNYPIDVKHAARFFSLFMFFFISFLQNFCFFTFELISFLTFQPIQVFFSQFKIFLCSFLRSTLLSSSRSEEDESESCDWQCSNLDTHRERSKTSLH
jgi:hypothetical protein